MTSKKDKLKFSDKALKESLEAQLAGLKDNFGDVGRNALWIGGSLLGVYAIIKLLNGGKKKKKSKKITIQQAEPVVTEQVLEKAKKENLLSSTVKEQLIIFLLGIAVERLTKFLSELDKEESNDSK